MAGALVTIVLIVVVFAGVVALYTVLTSGHAYREIGKGGMDVPPAAATPSATPPPEDRDEEIRELIEARNALRARRGEPALDVDDELATLTGAVPTDELRDELRALVEARNRRRERAGLQPLPVAAEIERRLRDLN
jgi:HAMP domain-containing protein